jgi:hypothetical protein
VTYSGGDGLTGRVGGTTPGYDSQTASGGRHDADSSLTWASACVRTLNALVRERVWERRARESLKRGGTSPEGASGPRARRNLTRGGVRPSSEAEPHPRGRPSLERGGTLPVKASGPRARRNLTRGESSPRARRSLGGTAVYPSSEAGFRPRGDEADRFGCDL